MTQKTSYIDHWTWVTPLAAWAVLLTALLTVLGLPEASRQIVFGAIIVVVAAAYTRVTDQT